ncbi:phosphoribosylglycinamide formyltransferase [Ornithinicoccus halotolerans]|uniref:phosphoribosylglycinamide formyltransferase n=1 Tax=Ornithinicoccus halotolerans TaxID=1748220 RepID=UPI0012976142|nr:phosphoribosylglycinamide formyltransferase [Ornithinicoccus halotolerans]
MPSTPPERDPVAVVVLVSGGGSTLQGILDATADPAYGVRVAAVGADRGGTEGLRRAERAGLATFVEAVGDHPDRAAWDAALHDRIAEHDPRLVVSAGFMKLLGPRVLAGWPVVNTHPALLPAFPGARAVRDALHHGVRVTGCTVHLVDEGVDTGPIIAQAAVPVREDDDEESLHARIKDVERPLLVDVVGRMAREGFHLHHRKVTIP